MLAVSLIGLGAVAWTNTAVAVAPAPIADSKPDSTPGAAAGVAGPTSPRDWKTPFFAAYRLEEGSALKHIPTPFIPERTDYHREREGPYLAMNPKPPDWMCFRQSGTEVRVTGFGMACDVKTNLRDVLRFVIRLGDAEFEGPEELLKLPIDGDWTTREGAAVDVLLPELAAVVRKEKGRRLAFEQRTVSRDAIVVRGAAKMKANREKGDEVHLYAEDPSDTGRSLHHSEFSDFLATLSDRLRLPAVNETTEAPEMFVWKDHKDANLPKTTDRREELTRMILANLSTQSGMTFTVEPRPVKVWFVTEVQ